LDHRSDHGKASAVPAREFGDKVDSRNALASLLRVRNDKSGAGQDIPIIGSSSAPAFLPIWRKPRNLERHQGLETGCEVTVDLPSDGLVCWPHPD
jgi:hypothetical protein